MLVQACFRHIYGGVRVVSAWHTVPSSCFVIIQDLLGAGPRECGVECHETRLVDTTLEIAWIAAFQLRLSLSGYSTKTPLVHAIVVGGKTLRRTGTDHVTPSS